MELRSHRLLHSVAEGEGSTQKNAHKSSRRFGFGA